MERILIELTPGQEITLDGYDPDAKITVEKINLWKGYANRPKCGAYGYIKHGETARFVKFTPDKQGAQIQYGRHFGWISWFFIKELKPCPITS